MTEFEARNFTEDFTAIAERANIKEKRDEILRVLTEIDKSKLSLQDLKLYAEILKTTAEVQVVSYSEMWPTLYSSLAFGFKSPTISDYKSEKSE